MQLIAMDRQSSEMGALSEENPITGMSSPGAKEQSEKVFNEFLYINRFVHVNGFAVFLEISTFNRIHQKKIKFLYLLLHIKKSPSLPCQWGYSLDAYGALKLKNNTVNLLFSRKITKPVLFNFYVFMRPFNDKAIIFRYIKSQYCAFTKHIYKNLISK